MQSATKYPGEGVDFTLGNRVTAVVRQRFNQRMGENLLYRPLHIYTVDPSVSYLQGAVATVKVPYEPLEPGPIGSLIEIVDSDMGDGPAERLDLDDPKILIQNGRLPSPRDRQFRQQMVYAVASLTYAAFQRALGRQPTWGFTKEGDEQSTRLRIRPHSQKIDNAHYRSDTGELCFGYYPASERVKGRNIPGGTVYTCLSHDIIVHETSHALLDGMRSSFQEGTIPDVDAFHEAFADIVAIFQHFSYFDVVLAAIQESRGNLRSASLLTDIARQFGHTTGADGPLRTSIDVTKKREDRLQYATASRESHELGTVLVSAIFEAFTTIFERKAAPYIRLATGGTGRLSKGELPTDLQQILTKTAQTLAKQFLNICIRAIDYCPPVDIEFGEYLRAVITADHDLMPDDPWGYREAWIDAFGQRGIYPPGIDSFSEDSLLWCPPERILPAISDLCFGELRFDGDPGQPASPEELRRQACALGFVVAQPEWIGEFGCVRPNDPKLGGDTVDMPCIQSIRTSRRVGRDGQILFDLVAEVVQRRWIRGTVGQDGSAFYGGATVIIDPHGRVRYVIRKSVLSETRLKRNRMLSNSVTNDLSTL